MQVTAARRVLVSLLFRRPVGAGVCGAIFAALCGIAHSALQAQQPTPPGAPAQPASSSAAGVSLPPYRARIIGVYDERSGDPVAGVTVSDFLSRASAVTNDAGLVSLIFLPDGGGLVRIRKVGYEPQVIPVAISPGDTAPVTLLLHSLGGSGATVLAGVSVTGAAPNISPALRGFQERMKGGKGGYFIGDSILRRNEGRQLADVMRSRLPSINLGAGNGRGAALLRSPRCVSMSTDPPGPPQVYLDGMPLTADPPPPSSRRPPPTKSIPFDLSEFDVSDLAGVEWYPSTDQVPEDFAHTSERCGVLLLWTREGSARNSGPR